MDELIRLLHDKSASLVVRSANGRVSFYFGRGVSDLHRLFSESPETLKGACLADKVVGKGAAALMIKAGVEKVHADLASESAVSLCCKYGLDFACDTVVPYIINRKKDGKCPVETLCGDETDIEELYCRINAFVTENYLKNK